MYWKLQAETTREKAIQLALSLEDKALSTSWFEQDESRDIWCFEALFSSNTDTSLIERALDDSFPFTLEYLEERDWLRENRAAFPPVQVGQFYIYGSHMQTPPPDGYISLMIDAATAFGTGEHGTTQGCLLLMEKLGQEGNTFCNILDLGCGTGILGMAASVLFDQEKVTLSDNDPDATVMALFNAERNGLKEKTNIIISQGFANPALGSCGPFDLIIANILAAPLIELAPAMGEHTQINAFIILSGLLDSQSESVQSAYEVQGFKLKEKSIMGDWAALLMERKN